MNSRTSTLTKKIVVTLLVFITISQFFSANLFGKQINIPRAELMPNIPEPFKMRDWKKVAQDYDALVFDFNAKGEFFPLIWIDKSHRNFDQDTFGLCTVVGDPRMGSDKNNGECHEAINTIAAVVGATLVGIDKSNQNGYNFVRMCENYFNRDNGRNVILNATREGLPGGGYAKDFWYDVFPNILFFSLVDQYPDVHKLEEIMRICAEKWCRASQILDGNYNYTFFDFIKMKPVTARILPQPDSAAGIGWLQYMAYVKFKDPKYLEQTDACIKALQKEKENPYYEVLLPYGVYTAARMNAELGRNYNVSKMINWCLGQSKVRRGWGVIVERWGNYDCYGLHGSTTHGGGYAFAMGTFENVGCLIPLVRYDDRFARAIGKYTLNAANAARLFYPDELPDKNQDCAQYKHLVKNVIAYEGLMKQGPQGQGQKYSPFGTGDAVGGNWGKTNFGLYGSSHVGIFGGIISKTNDEKILQLDCLKTDYFRDKAYPTYLYFNPYKETKKVDINVGPESMDLYDAVSNSFIKRNVKNKTSFEIPADSAILLVLVPSGKTVKYEANKTYINGIIIDYNNERAVVPAETATIK